MLSCHPGCVSGRVAWDEVQFLAEYNQWCKENNITNKNYFTEDPDKFKVSPYFKLSQIEKDAVIEAIHYNRDCYAKKYFPYTLTTIQKTYLRSIEMKLWKKPL